MMGLKRRGVKRVRLVISDAHREIQATVKKEWLRTVWQRRKLHFMRNILPRVAYKDKARLGKKIKQSWPRPDKKSAEKLARIIIEEYEKKYPGAMSCLEEGLEDYLKFYKFSEVDKRPISPTNVLERTNREIRRRNRGGGNVSFDELIPQHDNLISHGIYIRLGQ